MNRWSVIIVVLTFCGALGCADKALAQSAEHGELFSSDLVAWSFMQEPQQPEPNRTKQQPTPDPTPETQPTPSPTQNQPAEHTSPSQSESASKTPTAQTFTGTISKESDSYVLKVSDTTSYKLDNEQEVQPYEGKRVQVTGTLDRSINLIHVDKVEPLS
jgi:hypothetical protein